MTSFKESPTLEEKIEPRTIMPIAAGDFPGQRWNAQQKAPGELLFIGYLRF